MNTVAAVNEYNVQDVEHRKGRGGKRPGSGRPKMDPEEKRVRMSVGFTGDNLRWLRELSSGTNKPIARILNDLVTNEVARQNALDEDIEATLDQIL